MREAATAGAVPTEVPSGRSMRPVHAYWRARTLRTQLLSLFILIELPFAAAVAGAVSIFNAAPPPGSRSRPPWSLPNCR